MCARAASTAGVAATGGAGVPEGAGVSSALLARLATNIIVAATKRIVFIRGSAQGGFSEIDPSEEVQSIVVRRVAARPVVIIAQSIEFGVSHVLQLQFRVEPWQIIDLAKVAT